MHCWVQIPATHAKELEDNGEFMKGNGYRYKDSQTGEKMVEYHVTTIGEKLLKEFVNNQLGSNLSIQFPGGKCLIIIFSHDECIFKQFAMSIKSWVGPNGKTVIVPKDDGLSMMITAFQSQEWGLVWNYQMKSCKK